MTTKTTPPDPPEPDLIDRIANELPANMRADWYRELRHCRSLPENDEMLRILRAMQFLTLLMVRVPEQVVVERKELERLFSEAMLSLQKMLKASEASRAEVDRRLVELPGSIALGIKPDVIASTINESLRQQFIRSTIPDTARALGSIAKDMKHVTAEFGTTASSLGKSYRGAAEEARQAIENIHRGVSQAADTARRVAQDLYDNFYQAYWWSVYVLTGLALLTGVLLGMLIGRSLAATVDPVVDREVAPMSQPAPHILPSKKPKG